MKKVKCVELIWISYAKFGVNRMNSLGARLASVRNEKIQLHGLQLQSCKLYRT